METEEPPLRFQFGLGAMFILVAIVASAVAATKASNIVVGIGVAMVTGGGWIIFRGGGANDDIPQAGWVLAIIGIIYIVLGAMSDAMQ